jgi:DNA polymerase-3 subunit gamma/tau
VVFIFATTEIHKIPATILSRCQHYNFRRIARGEIIERLRHVAAQDQVTIEERSLTALARASEGSMRDALSLLDQAVAFGGKAISHADLEVLLGAVPQELVQALIRAIMAQDSPAALAALANLLDQGHDLRAFCAEVVEHIRNLLVAAVVPMGPELRGLIEASEEDVRQLAMDAKALTPEQLQELLTIFTQAEDALRLSAHPRFVLETAAVRATRLLGQRDGGATRPTQAASTPSERTPAARPETVKSEPAPPMATAGVAPAPPRRAAPAAPKPASPRTAPPPRQELREDPVPVSTGLSGTPVHNEAAVPPADAQAAGGTKVNWEAVQEEVAGSYPNIAPFLEAGRYVGMEGGIVTIGFTKQATVARAMLEKQDNLRTLAKLCEQQSGHPVRIRIVELTEADPPGPTMAQLRAAKEQDERLVLFERARANPMVKQALEMFGAELAEVRTVAQKEASE